MMTIGLVTVFCLVAGTLGQEAERPGQCPPPTGAGICVEACSSDSSCPDRQKCCSNGCGHVCTTPVPVSLDVCQSAPCQNGGSCTSSNDSYTCQCVYGFGGLNCQRTIYYVGNWPPEFSQCPSDQYHSIADTKPGVNVTWREPYIRDDYGETTQPVQTCGPQSGSILEPGFYTVIYKATDRVGQHVECSFDIEIQAYAAIDVCQSAPCQNGGDCISSSSYSYTCSCAPYSGFSGTNCEIPPESFECLLPCANGATCIDTIDWYVCRCTPGYTGTFCDVYSPATTPSPTPVDYSPPEFRPCPADIARRIPASDGGVRVTWPEPRVEDDSGETIHPVQTFGPLSGSVFQPGSHLIAYEARDSAGNTAFCSFDVRVTTYEPPSIFCPIDIRHWLSAGESSAVISWAMPTVLSSSGPARMTYQSMESGSRLGPGTYTVRYRYTDDSALEASCSFTITIHDYWKPQHPIQHSKNLTLTIVIGVVALVVVLAVVMSIGLYMYNKRRSINNGDSSSTCGGMRILKNEHLPAEEPRYSTPAIEKTQEIA